MEWHKHTFRAGVCSIVAESIAIPIMITGAILGRFPPTVVCASLSSFKATFHCPLPPHESCRPCAITWKQNRVVGNTMDGRVGAGSSSVRKHVLFVRNPEQFSATKHDPIAVDLDLVPRAAVQRLKADA